ncbi:unnamed protein product [Mytilus coruscus]|uniref:Reverse transcriptase/retrotransposon-derived protein RNase H-like domain-containing protein n=1 Tax=Mytilus coruscus TaxID=42192 RepID=A0A6J8DUU7_MYTCO|nr:unnamed protein product [Mytilus coruscus]
MERIKEIAFQTCKGACSDYIQRYLRDHRDTTWEQLKKELISRFGEITDPQHASTLLRQLKQKGDEFLQIYAENLLNLANVAYSDLDGHNEAIERELVGIFIDGLAHSYLIMKLMRENPAIFALAVKSAMTEQNLRKRFTFRTERVNKPRYKTTRPMTLNRPRRTEPLNSHEPMEIDHYRDAKRCYTCGKVGHVSRKDWLVQNGVRLYFDLGCLRIQKKYVPLEEDIHVASILRLTVNAVLKPINLCPVGLKNNPSFGSNNLLEISPVASGYVSTEPGLMIKEINLVNVNQSQGTSGLEKLDESEISVPQEFKKYILRKIRDNEDIFATSDKDLGCTDTVQMTIDTGDHPPIKLKPYRPPLNQRKIIDKTIEEVLEANIIRKSRSAWAAPIIIVSKMDKTSRMCVDYRSLIAVSKIYFFPLPLIDDLLASVGKAKVMTSLDLKSGFYKVKVKESDKEKTAFVCHKGLFEFNVLPFGLASGPSLFSELVTEILKRLRPFKAPSNVREVRGLIGCLSYYRRFVPSFSKIAEPIVALTRKNKVFDWINTCQVAFEKLRGELVKVPLLAYPDLNKPYVLYTDASYNCVGACLTQLQESPIEGENEVERPIYFLSHKLSDTQTPWSTIEKEAFAIHYALQK